MSEDMLYQLLATVPANATHAMVVYRDGNTLAVKWIGMTPEQVAELLYRAADLVVTERIPPRRWALPG